jgi:hypothetical protein
MILTPTRRSLALLVAALTSLGVAGCGDDSEVSASWHANAAASGAAGGDDTTGGTSPSAAATTGPWPFTVRAGIPAPEPGQVVLGAYVDVAGQSHAASIAKRKSELGRYYAVDHEYYDWGDSLPSTAPWLAAGQTLMISWGGTSYSSINSGSQDSVIANQADALKKYGKPVLLRWAWEMNGSWYAWGGSKNGNNPAGFVKAWQHIHDIFANRGAANVGWIWGPNYYSLPTASWNTIDAYYPGDAYVDWVGVSAYSDGVKSPDELFGPVYNTYGKRKPIMIAETGVKERGGTVKADWINGLRTWIEARPTIGALIWFDSNDATGVNVDWRVDTSAGATAAFRNLANDPKFQGLAVN